MSTSLAAAVESLEEEIDTRRTRDGPRAILYAVWFVLVACAGRDPAQAECTNTSTESIVNGSDTESYLGLAPAQQRAVVRVQDRNQPDGALCSGVFVKSDWIATAAHCLQIESAQVLVAGPDATTFALPVVTALSNSDQDVALLKVDVSSVPSLPDIEPITVAKPNDPPLVAGQLLEMAGYGLTESGTVRELRFLVEPSSALTATSITVDGSGASGACDGDSGGPLLARDASGHVVLLGTLSLGSSSCRNEDEYVRLDALQGWLTQTLGPPEPAADECGNIDGAGRCLDGMPMWCAGGTLHAATCGGGTACGWEAAQSGFRCVATNVDPCHGVDSNGACFQGVPARCAGGMLALEPCGCGLNCRLDGATGGALCAH
ncbi:MAG TPA: S1 family peptidase [Polyangiaceae bacterium]|jgi:hypothetical protein